MEVVDERNKKFPFVSRRNLYNHKAFYPFSPFIKVFFSFFVIFFGFFFKKKTLMLSLLLPWQRIRVLSPHNPPRVKESSLVKKFSNSTKKCVGCFSSDFNNPLKKCDTYFVPWKPQRRRSTLIWKLFVSSQADGAGCQYNKQSKHKKKLKQTRSSSSAGVFVKQPCKDVYIYIPAVCFFFSFSASQLVLWLAKGVATRWFYNLPITIHRQRK